MITNNIARNGRKMAPLSKTTIVISSLLVLLSYSHVNAEYEPGSKPPRIFKIGSNTNIENHHLILKEGATNQFKLECDVEVGAFPEPVIQWYKNAEIISKDTIQDIVITDKNEIEFVEPSNELHEGYYYCTAKNSIGLAKSEIILVSSSIPKIGGPEVGDEAPVFTIKPEVEIQEVGKTVEFRCDAEGVPRPEVKWTFNGDEIGDTETLTIKEITEDNIGTYACNVSNRAGYEHQEVYLNILTKAPIFVEKPKKEQTVSIGMEAYLRCKAKGYPTPSIQWFFENKEIVNDSDYTISDRGDLTIKKVQAQMEGAYECRASNGEGTDSVAASLKVVRETTIIAGPKSVEAQVQGTVRINCSVVWDPASELEVSWKKDNVDMRIDGERITSDPSDNFLTIRNLNFADGGVYTCVAATDTGSDTDSGTLKVTGMPAELLQGPSDVTVLEGTDIQILCTVKGYPLPTHKWYKWENPNGDESGGKSRRIMFDDPESRIRLDNSESGTLIIANANLEDSGKYVCRAENKYSKNPVIESAVIDVRRRSKAVSPEYQKAVIKFGQDVLFDCHVDVDPRWNNTLKVNWLKEEKELNLTKLAYDQSIDELEENQRFVLLSNRTLQIRSPTEADLGNYKCQIRTGIDEVVLIARLSMRPNEEWILILIIIIICVLILLILIMCIICVRKRARRKGRYGVKDVSDGKHKNRSEIQYSIDDDTESLHKELDPDLNTTTPIIKPSSNNKPKGNSSPLASNGDLKGSENSLLNMTDEDLWLRKGMDEDGSFRQVCMD